MNIFTCWWRLISGHGCLHGLLWATYGIYSAGFGEVTQSIGTYITAAIGVLCVFIFILPNNLNCLAGWQNTNSSSFYENSYSSAWCFPCFGMLVFILSYTQRILFLFWVIHNEFYLFIFVGKKLDCSSSIPSVINMYTLKYTIISKLKNQWRLDSLPCVAPPCGATRVGPCAAAALPPLLSRRAATGAGCRHGRLADREGGGGALPLSCGWHVLQRASNPSSRELRGASVGMVAAATAASARACAGAGDGGRAFLLLRSSLPPSRRRRRCHPGSRI